MTMKTVTTLRFTVLGLPNESDYSATAGSVNSTGSNSNKLTGNDSKQASLQVVAHSKKIQSVEVPTTNNPKNKTSLNATTSGATSSSVSAGIEKVEEEWTLELEQDYQRILSVGEECISPGELKALLLRKGRQSCSNTSSAELNQSHQQQQPPRIVLYDGFEPSGRMHIAQGVFKAMNVNKCTYPGTNSTFVFWVADWFALMNDKMGGDLDKIKVVGQYLIEVWKAAGMDLSNVVFKWASEEITTNAHKYWPIVLDVARRFTITRVKKCCQIMGRLEGSLTSAQILYPLMQCADVFFLNADICQLGVDQRKVNMLAREYCDSAKRKIKPIILSHHMLYGLKAGQEKMSKSDPDSAIFMEDSIDDVERKIRNSYCPNQEQQHQHQQSQEVVLAETVAGSPVENDAGKESLQLVEDKLKNPCLDYLKNIVFSPPNVIVTVRGDSSGGAEGDGTTKYTEYDSIKDAFLNGTMTENQLKTVLIEELNQLLEPVRQHFQTNEHAKNLFELVKQYKKETLVQSSIEKSSRRLDLRILNKIPSESTHLVFAPLPTAQPTLQMAVDVLFQIRSAVPAVTQMVAPSSTGSDGNPRVVVLYIQDWSAIVSNSCSADLKVIQAYYTILLSALKALDPILMEENVHILYQSDAILSDPSSYWISVINVGRHFMLNDVMGASIHDEDNAGLVVARLMEVADAVSVNPKTLVGGSSLSSASSLTTTVTPGDKEEVRKGDEPTLSIATSGLIQQFYQSKLKGMTVPELQCVPIPSIRLQPIRESDALKTENDEYFLLDDPKVHGKSKMKKSFCEPCNISFCPPISIASVFAFGKGGTSSSSNTTCTGFEIKRSSENGGNVLYTTTEQLINDFALGENVLHPGDLKETASTLIISVLEKINTTIQNDKVAVAASKTLKAFSKKKK